MSQKYILSLFLLHAWCYEDKLALHFTSKIHSNSSVLRLEHPGVEQKYYQTFIKLGKDKWRN